jgi:hypothetical protein
VQQRIAALEQRLSWVLRAAVLRGIEAWLSEED